jgi:hypothetical protein
MYLLQAIGGDARKIERETHEFWTIEPRKLDVVGRRGSRDAIVP